MNAGTLWHWLKGTDVEVKSLKAGGVTNYLEVSDAGAVSMAGNARVKRYLWLDVTGLRAPGTKPAVEIDYGIGGAWEFTNGTDDTITARFKVPEDIDLTVAPAFLLGWSTPTSNAGNCRWQIEYVYRAVGEAMDAAADETLVDNFAASSTAKGLVLSTLTASNLISATDLCITVRVKRRADEGADTLGEDNQLFGLCLEYTSNKLGTAL